MGVLVYPAGGARTQFPGNAAANISTSSKARGFVFAGPGSRGLVIANAAQSPNIQFGTTTTDVVANTSFTAQVANQEEGGASPTLVETDANGDQSLGYGRIRWEASTGNLYMHHKADDALVAGSPRVQLYTNRLQHAALYHRIYFAFTLGTPEMPWPAYSTTSGLNSILVFQIKNDADEPSLTLDVKTAQSGDTTKRDLVMTYRDAAGSSPVDIGAVRDIATSGEVNYCILDLFLDWRTPDGGGTPYTAWWHNGALVELDGGQSFDGPNVYSTSLTLARPMVGIYRYTRSAKAPDGCGITVNCFRVEQFAARPRQWSYEGFARSFVNVA